MPRGWAGRGALSDALAVTMLTSPIVQFQRQGKDLEKVKQRLIEIANHVDKVRSFPGNYVTQIVYMFGNQVGDDAHLVCLSRGSQEPPLVRAGPGTPVLRAQNRGARSGCRRCPPCCRTAAWDTFLRLPAGRAEPSPGISDTPLDPEPWSGASHPWETPKPASP